MDVAEWLRALLHDVGTLRPGSRRMADALSVMMLSMLELSEGQQTKTQDRCDDPAAQADDDGDDAMLDMPIEDVIALRVPEPAPAPPRSPRRQAARAPQPMIPIKTIRPPHPIRETAEKPEPPVRRRHRPRF